MIPAMLAAPLVAALLAWLFRHVRPLAAAVSVAGVLGLAFMAIQGIGASPFVVLGRTLSLDASSRMHLAVALGLLAVALAATARLEERDIACTVALAGVGLLVGFMVLQTLSLGNLMLQAGLVVLAMLIPLKVGDLAPINLRALIVLVWAGALALAGLWAIEHPAAIQGGSPIYVGPTALVAAYGAMLGAFPFFVWKIPIYRSDSSLARVMFGVVVPHLLLARLLALQGGVLAPAAQVAPTLLLNMGIATFVVGCIGALAQHTVSGLLGYMAMSEIGVVLIALGWGQPTMGALAMAHLLSRGIAVVAMSMGVGILRQSFVSDHVSDLRGAIRRAPLASLGILLAGFSLAGLPPLAGFFTRLALYRVIAIEDLGWSVALVVLGLAPAWAMVRFAENVFQIAPVPESRREPPWPATLVLLLGLLTLAWGLFPQALGHLPWQWADLLFGLAAPGG